MAKSTLAAYDRAWTLFLSFYHSYHTAPFAVPIGAQLASDFISFLHINGYASATIITYISALGFHHKILGAPDPMSHFLVRTQLKSLSKGSPGDCRLPVTKPILLQVLDVLPESLGPGFAACLLSAAFTLAFKACLRLSEYAAPTKVCNHTLQVSDIFFSDCKLIVLFSSFKHSSGPARVEISDSWFGHRSFFEIVKSYLQMRPTGPGPLFIFPDGVPVPRTFFTKHLRSCISRLGYDVGHFSSHSLRIGGATQLVLDGMTVLQVQNFGRWRSTAFYDYIRPYVIQCP